MKRVALIGYGYWGPNLLRNLFETKDCEVVYCCDLSMEKKKIIMVDHTFLFHNAVLKIKDLIKSGELGDILYIDSVRSNLGLFQPDVNVIYDLATHDLSIIQFLLEMKPISIQATG